MFDENATQLGPTVFVEEVEEVCPLARFEVVVSVALLIMSALPAASMIWAFTR